MKKGILINENLRITTYDKLNVVVQKFTEEKEIEDKTTGEKKVKKASWDNVSYHPSVKMAIESICRKSINLVADEAKEVIKKIDELENIIKNIKVVDLNE